MECCVDCCPQFHRPKCGQEISIVKNTDRANQLLIALAAEVRLTSAGSDHGQFPILDLIGNLRDEIAGSQRRMERELNRPVLHFCYPNGKMRDIGPRVVEAVRAAGMRTAVTAEPGLNRAGREALLLQRIAADPGHAEDYFRQGLAGLRGS